MSDGDSGESEIWEPTTKRRLAVPRYPAPSPPRVVEAEVLGESEFSDESAQTPMERFNRRDTEEEQSVRPYLEYLYTGQAEKIQDKPTYAEKVNEAFMNLEGFLGEAGQRCVEQYHLWGDQFWQKDEESQKLFTGLINAYWHQVNIVSSYRKRAIIDMFQPLEPLALVPPLVSLMITNFDEISSRLPQKSQNLFRLEVGHFKSINRQIRRNAGLRCDEDLTSCRKIDAEKWAAWNAMVKTIITKWKGKAKFRKDVLENFRRFLINPELNLWNRLIASNVLAKFQKSISGDTWKFLGENTLAEGFLTLAVNNVQEEIQKDWNSLNVKGRYPTGYRGLIDLMMESKKTQADVFQAWQSINFLLSQHAGEDKLTTEQLLAEIDKGVDQLEAGEDISQDPGPIPSDVSEALGEEDPSVENDKKRAKKRGERKKKQEDKRQEQVERQILDEEISLGSAEAETDPEKISTRQLLNEFKTIAREFEKVRNKMKTQPEDHTILKTLQDTIKAQHFFSEFLDVACDVQNTDLSDREKATDVFGKVQRFDWPRAQPMEVEREEFESFEGFDIGGAQVSRSYRRHRKSHRGRRGGRTRSSRRYSRSSSRRHARKRPTRGAKTRSRSSSSYSRHHRRRR